LFRPRSAAYQKYGEKESFDWPLADAGIVLVMDAKRCRKAAVVMGVGAPTPIRSQAAGIEPLVRLQLIK
jgi:xanthine dehydrogenase YagS FAD-binding subunit